MGEFIELVAEWRECERQLEAGLEPKLAARLDELRAEHARAVSKPLERVAVVRTLDPQHPRVSTESQGHRVTLLTPVVAFVKAAEKTKAGSLAAWRRG